jgi:hypothetical protein
MYRIQFEVIDKPPGKLLLQRHLNFEVRYHCCAFNIVTHKSVWFNETQIHPSVAKCCKGQCVLALCRTAEENSTFPEKLYDASKDADDPLIGKLVKTVGIGLGGVTFHDPDGSDECLDLNWKRLRNMAYPVVDEQLAKIVMEGKWQNKPLRVDLGTLLLDNSTIRIDKDSYTEMDKDNKADLVQCEVAWDRKVEKELKKRGILKVGTRLVKHRKWNTVENLRDLVEDVVDTKENTDPNVADEVKKEGEVEKTTKKCGAVDEPTEGLPVEASMNEPGDEPEECAECGEYPCVWLSKEHDMIFFDQVEHEHLPQEDMPPNNIRRKKLYRQMTLHIQAGQVQKGVRHELPECVARGTRELFPSPTFMGFKYN